MEKNYITYKLPEGWIEEELGRVTLVNMGQSPASSSYNTHGIGLPFYQGKTDFGELYPTVTKYCSEPIKIADKNDILISVRAPIGPTNLTKEKSCIGRGLAGIKTFCGVPSKFILFQLRSSEESLTKFGTGTTFKAISKSILEQFPIKIAPLKEQERIVSKIEELFSELDHAEVVLNKAQKQLEIYRQSLLKSAFEGELTKAWRESNNTVSAFNALKIIKEERRSKYEISLKNKTIKKPEKDFEFEFSQNDKIDTWANATLDNLIDINARIGWRGLKKDEYIKNGPLFLSVYSLNYGKNIVFDDANHITIERYEESPEIQLKEDDILLCKDGAGIGKIGIIKHLPDKATVNSSLLVIKAKEIFVPDFLYYLLSGPMMQELVKEKISGSAIPHLFQKEIKKFNLNVPPIDEQMQIVNQLESRFALTDNLNNSITNGLKRTSVLRHTILSKAFKGEIVSQNSNDDSAKNLLKQIRKEKELYLVDMKEKIKLKPAKIKIMENKKTVLDILLEAKEPISAKELWQQSKHKENIEEFYSELKDIQNKIIEIKKDTESFLALKR